MLNLTTYVCFYIAAVVCSNGDLRLRGGTTRYEGRVELCYNETWGTICDGFWSTNDANVACRQLGYADSGMKHFIVNFFSTSVAILLLFLFHTLKISSTSLSDNLSGESVALFDKLYNIVYAHLQVLQHYSMPSSAVALAPSFWMICCVLVLRQDSSTVQGLPVRELGHMTSVQMAMVKMLVSDALTVSDSWKLMVYLLLILHTDCMQLIHTQTTNNCIAVLFVFIEENDHKIQQFVKKICLKDSLTY